MMIINEHLLCLKFTFHVGIEIDEVLILFELVIMHTLRQRALLETRCCSMCVRDYFVSDLYRLYPFWLV